jgi:hypothetical protein
VLEQELLWEAVGGELELWRGHLPKPA